MAFIGFFVLKTGLARLSIAKNPTSTTGYSAEFSDSLLAKNENEIKTGLSLKDVQRIQGRAQAALLAAPLNHRSFLHIALANSIVDQKITHRELFEISKQRNTHNRRALRSLLALDLQQNDLASAMDNLDILLRLWGQDMPLFFDTIVAIASTEEGRPFVDPYLQKGAGWGQRVLKTQIDKMTLQDAAHIQQSLAYYSMAKQKPANIKRLDELFMQKLVRLEAYEQAYSYWQSKLANDQNFARSLVHDEEFNGSSALAPFNWKLLTNSKFFSERDGAGGLFASYTDKYDRILAYQILRLAPTDLYSLTIDASWEYRQRQGMFVWRVTCLPSKQVIVDVNMDDKTRIKNVVSSDFTIPDENCSAQRIQLLGKTGQYSERISASIRSVVISSKGKK